MKPLNFALGCLVTTGVVGATVVVYNWWKNKGKDEGDSNDSDDEENNWPELRYGIYKNPTPGPSWREDDEVSPNPA